METVEIKKDNALKALQAAVDGAQLKDVIGIMLGQDTRPASPLQRIFTFELACADRGYQPDDPRFTGGTPDQNAYMMLTLVIIPALREGTIPDWNDGDEEKWWGYFYMNDPGFRFGGADFGYSDAYWTGGSRLCLRSREEFMHLVEYFLPVLKDLYC